MTGSRLGLVEYESNTVLEGQEKTTDDRRGTKLDD